MTRMKLMAGVLAATLLPAGGVLADPWKNESGNGRGAGGDRWEDASGGWNRGEQDRGLDGERDSDWDRGAWRPGERVPPFDRRRDARAEFPAGHLPPPGDCRVWYPDRPAGHQPPPSRC